MASKKTLPKRIYVTEEKDDNDPKHPYLMAAKTMEVIEDGAVVGIYELVDTKTMLVTKALK